VLRQSGGDLGVALLVWLLGSVLALLGALTFGELGRHAARRRGSYVYVRDAFGPLPAFLLGWTLFLAINCGGTATLAVAFANYLGELVPLAPARTSWRGRHDRRRGRREHPRRPPGGERPELEHGAQSRRAPRPRGGRVALGDGFIAPTPAPSRHPSLSRPSQPPAWRCRVLWAYEGWQNVTNSAGEARDPQRNLRARIGFGRRRSWRSI